MAHRNNIRNQKRIARRASDRRIVVRSAKDASKNAKRSSNALDLEYKIIKNGILYKVTADKITKVAAVPRVEVKKSGLTKGSKIWLK